MARISDAVSKMQRLLNEQLDPSRVGRVINPPQPLSFATVAREAESLVAGRIAARQVEVSIEDSPSSTRRSSASSRSWTRTARARGWASRS